MTEIRTAVGRNLFTLFLFAQDVYKEDAGNYKCHAVNKFGDIEQVGQLLVRCKYQLRFCSRLALCSQKGLLC